MRMSASEKREALFLKLGAKGVSPERLAYLRRIVADGASPEIIKRLRTDMQQTMSVQDIADLFGISRQGVYHHIAGEAEQLDQPDRVRIQAVRPFAVESRHQKCTLYNNLTSHIKYMISGPESLSERRARVLVQWWKTLSPRYVLVYDPAETSTALARCGGWRLDDREESDGDLIVRPHGEPTEEQRRVLSWRRIEEALKRDRAQS
ncbi:hypothetical protein ACWD4V_16205 [Streptomyces tsukubensis]